MNNDLSKKILQEIARCRKCGSCQASCPVYRETPDEAASPRGKIALSEAMLTGRLKPTKPLLDRISKCLSCYACSYSCVNRVNTVEILNFTKNRLFDRKKLLSLPDIAIGSVLKSSPVAGLAFRFLRNLIAIYKRIPSTKMRKFPGLGRKRHFPEPQKGVPATRFTGTYPANTSPRLSVLFFPGCLAEITEGESIMDIIEFLNDLGVHVSIPPGMVCCGAPSYYRGDYETTRELISKNTRAVSADNRSTCMVTACATCGHILKNIYPELSNDRNPLKLPVMDIQEFLISIPGFRKILNTAKEPLPDKKIKVTYHDPCHLKRGQNIYNEPREILKELPEIEFIEMEDADRCCGGGGTFCLNHPTVSQGIAKHKAEAIKNSGAGIVTTACPSCRLQLTDITKESGIETEVVYTVQLLRKILKARNKKERKTGRNQPEVKIKKD